MEKVYTEVAKKLVEKVRKLNPKAQVIKNWNKDPKIVSGLIKSWHKNVGKEFLESPFEYLEPRNFK